MPGLKLNHDSKRVPRFQCVMVSGFIHRVLWLKLGPCAHNYIRFKDVWHQINLSLGEHPVKSVLGIFLSKVGQSCTMLFRYNTIEYSPTCSRERFRVCFFSLFFCDFQVWSSFFFSHYSAAFNSSHPSAAYMRMWIGSTLAQIITCRLFGAKPLSKPMLRYCQLYP